MEQPFVAVQAQRAVYEEHLVAKPVFCTACCSPAGPLEATLALAAGHVSRADVIDVARSTGGGREELLRWLAFAAKLPALPAASQLSSEGLFVDIPQVSQPRTQSAFCSAACRDAWLRLGRAVPALRGDGELWSRISEHAEGSGHECVLMMAARAAVRAFATGPDSPRALAAELAPVLGLAPSIRTASRASVPQRAVARSHKLLVDALAEACLAQDAREPAGQRLSKAAAKRKVLALLPASVHARVVAALDIYGWGLDGATLPSLLAQYCEATCKPETPKAQQAEVLTAVGPVVKALCEQQDRLDSEAEEDDEAAAEECETCDKPDSSLPDPWASLPVPEVAQKTKPIVVPQLLSSEEIAHIKSLSQELAAQEHAKHADSSQWRTRYLHSGGAFRRLAPAILEKILRAAAESDVRPGGWGFLSKIRDHALLRPRCVEHHLVSPGGALPDPTHYDGGSLLTLDVMLARPGEDFEGGEFCTLEADGTSAQHSFGFGDALVFASHKQHHVRPVRSGLRETLIMELWEGEERTCDHRCERHWGKCAFEAPAREAPATAEGSAVAAEPSEVASAEALDALAGDAARAFAPTAFEGQAFFARVGRLMAQSEGLRRRGFEPNVEVAFEQPAPLATVRALRRLRRGEPLVVAACGGESEEEEASGSGSEDDGASSSSEA